MNPAAAIAECGASSAPSGTIGRPYLSAAQLAELTPWSLDAIEKHVRRGTFRKGVHYFQLERRGKLIFKWAAIIALIECGTIDDGGGAREIPVDERTQSGAQPRAQRIDVEEATTKLQRLLD